MAPGLKKTRKNPAKPSTRAKPAGKPSTSGKRKASDDGSPDIQKKQKPARPNGSSKPSRSVPTAVVTASAPENQPAVKSNPQALDRILPDAVQHKDAPGGKMADTELESFLKGFESFDDDDEETANVDSALNGGVSLFRPGQDVGKIPKPKLGNRDHTAGTTGGQSRGVLYVGRIPHGFYEHQMRTYFSQFGIISNLRLSRNKQTGQSKHYAFIEFAEATTAEIAARTMNNYLLFGHLLKCRLVPPESVHPNLWRGANRRFKIVPRTQLAARKLQQARTEAAWATAVTKENNRRLVRASKLKEQMDYVYDAPELKKAIAPAPVLSQLLEAQTPAVPA